MFAGDTNHRTDWLTAGERLLCQAQFVMLRRFFCKCYLTFGKSCFTGYSTCRRNHPVRVRCSWVIGEPGHSCSGQKYSLLVVESRVDKRRYHPKLGEFGCKVLDTLGVREHVEKQDTVLGHAARFEDIDSHDGRAAWRVV